MPKDVFGRRYPFLKSGALLRYDEIETLVKAFAKLGVGKIRLTGGEPLLRKDLERLIVMLSDIPGIEDITITTNASLLTQSRARSLRAAGIRRINISLDALRPEISRKINPIPYPLQDILDGINHALETGFESVKINMVVQKGINDGDILSMVQNFRGTGAILRFIEFMDVGNHNRWRMDKVMRGREIIDLINPIYPLQPVGANYASEVAKRWRFVDGEGEIGVISSITQPFCGDCTRARLSAKGELFTCLFATSGHDLKQLLSQGMSEIEIREKISSIWARRDDQYSMLRTQKLSAGNLKTRPPGKQFGKQSQKVEMSYIGG